MLSVIRQTGLISDVVEAGTPLFTFALVTLVLYAVGRFAVVPFARTTLERRETDTHIQQPLMKLISIVTTLGAVAAGLEIAGFENFLQSVATVSAAGTVAIGFATKDIVRNFVSGIFIFADAPFKIGDWIEWNDNSGIVEEIGLRVTSVRTFDDQLLTVPNSDLTDTTVLNHTDSEQLRLTPAFGIGYGCDIDTARNIIIQKARDHTDIIDEPSPAVAVTELEDSYVGLQAAVWIANPRKADTVRVESELRQQVKEQFDEENIEMPYQYRQIVGELSVDN